MLDLENLHCITNDSLLLREECRNSQISTSSHAFVLGYNAENTMRILPPINASHCPDIVCYRYRRWFRDLRTDEDYYHWSCLPPPPGFVIMRGTIHALQLDTRLTLGPSFTTCALACGDDEGESL